MTDKESPVTDSPLQEPGASARPLPIGRRGLLVMAALAIAAGLALNWSWLVATGAAPILIAVLPCLVMCGLGLCMNQLTGGSCENQHSARDPGAAAGPADVARLDAGIAGPAAGSVPVVRRQPVRRSRKQPAKRQSKVKATS